MADASPSTLGRIGARWPWAGSAHGPLPGLLVALTVLSGVVDAVSYIGLGHVFVANMTGNILFLGLALAGERGLSTFASLAALAAFLLGALAGGAIATRFGEHRGRHLRTASAVALVPLLVAIAVAAALGQPVASEARYALIVPMALAMGIQNATARRLAVPDLTTTVLTLTLTGIAADSRLAGGPGGHPGRRLTAVAAMFIGAIVGGLLALRVDLVLPLIIAFLLMAVTAGVANRHSTARSDWTRRTGSG